MAATPCLVVEVLSPSIRDFGTFEKLGEYKSIASMDYVMMVEPNAPDVVLWQRTGEREWERRGFESLDETMDLPEIGVNLPLGEIYDGVQFPRRPRLV